MTVHSVRRRCLIVSLLVLTTVAIGGWFQAPAPSPAQIPAPTIRVSTHLVVVDVVVTDKQGKAVTGLHPEDFVVEGESLRNRKVNHNFSLGKVKPLF